MIDLYALPCTDFFRGPEVRVGDTVWFAFDHHHVVQCRARDVLFYCCYPERPDAPGFFVSCDDLAEISEGISPSVATLQEYYPDEKFSGAARASQWIWIDEPVGHSVQIWSPETCEYGPGYDDVFLRLDQALQVVAPRRRSRRRGQSALRRYRRDHVGFIRATGNLGVDLVQYPDKLVYCRKR